jgi:hypothetical protein
VVLAGPAFELPGVRFEPQPPPPPDVLPRMDVAGFVGLAARGPIDTPVAVDDLAGFTAVFGGDLVRGMDPDEGTEVTAQLRPSVAAFFRNGGQRCWVVRVASEQASAVRFRLPGVLVSLPAGPNGVRPTERAGVRASSVGGWAADLAVGAGLEVASIGVAGIERQPNAQGVAVAGNPVVRLRLEAGGDCERGDVVRIRTDDGTLLFAVIDGLRPAPAAGTREPDRIAEVGAVDAFQPAAPGTGTRGRATCWAAGADLPAVRARVRAPRGDDDPDQLALELNVTTEARPADGSWVRFDTARGTWWVVANEVRSLLIGTDPRVLVLGPSFRHLDGATGLLAAWADAVAPVVVPAVAPVAGEAPGPVARVDRLRIALFAGAGALTEVLPDLGLAPGHPRFVGALPADEGRFGPDPARPWDAAAARRAAAGAAPRQLAGLGEAGFLVPLAAGAAPRWLASPDDPGTDYDRARGDTPVGYLDPALATVDAARLVAEADFIRYQAPVPRTLRGIHALLDVDEVTLLSMPDLGGGGWSTATHGRPPTPRVLDPIPPVLTFDLCAPGAPETPQPRLEWLGGGGRGFRIAWPRVAYATAYEVEVVPEPATWARPAIAERRRPRYVETAPAPGVRRFRVRSVNRNGRSAWSGSIRVATGPAVADRPDREPDLGAVLGVQAAAVRLCAARGDVLGILSLPRVMAADAVLGHLDRLRAEALTPGAGVGDHVPRATGAEGDPLHLLSHAALYHPWVVTVADPAAAGIQRARDALPLGSPVDRATAPRSRPTAIGVPRALPPDGPVLGTYAARTRERGAWVAAANVGLRDVVAIDRPVGDDDLRRLHAGGLNIVRRTPAGFLVLASHTLSEDPLLRRANVRRLLALLRRAALLHGPEYVFEPNGPALRRRVERAFEALLALLYARGAFAGARAADAYRLEVGEPPNSPQGMEAGRLVVDLKVAPSVPLEFLTIRMVRSGDRLAVEGA